MTKPKLSNRAGLHIGLVVVSAVLIFSVGLIYGLCALIGFNYGYADVAEYSQLVNFDFDEVTEPFASRLLGPLLAHGLILVLPVSSTTALAWVSASATLVLVVFWAHYMLSKRISLSLTMLAFAIPYISVIANYIYVPDALAVLLGFSTLYFIKRNTTIAPFVVGSLSILTRMTLVAPYLVLATLKAIRNQLWIARLRRLPQLSGCWWYILLPLPTLSIFII